MLVLALLFIATITVSLKAQDNKERGNLELTEVQKLKAENLKLKITIAQLQATLQDRENKLNGIELSNEQSELLKEFKTQLKPKEDEIFNWDRFVFEPKPDSDKK